MFRFDDIMTFFSIGLRKKFIDNSAEINFSCNFLSNSLSWSLLSNSKLHLPRTMSSRVNQFILHIFMVIKSSLWFCVLLMTYFTLRKSYKLFHFTMLLSLFCVCKIPVVSSQLHTLYVKACNC